MTKKRQKTGNDTTWAQRDRGEASKTESERVELGAAANDTKSPATKELMEEILERENLKQAYHRVVKNKGAPGIDGITVETLKAYLATNWETIRKQLLSGTYAPRAVKRVEIPKSGGGIRKLGIPTVIDRFIQQAILQVLQRMWDRTFSEHSYGFRPERSQHQAVAKAQEYIRSGLGYVVDIDLEKFFDRVNHDILMSRIAKRVEDKRLLKLLRAYLNAGILENGLVQPSTEGVPQGGPLSPLLSNLMLDELDCELEKRGLAFVRYADDCNIYVSSERAGARVMESITKFLDKRLRLRVNKEKSAVGKPSARKFLGFSFTHKDARRRISPQALERAKKRIRELTRATKGNSLEQVVEQLTKYLRGWIGYFRYCETPSVLQVLDGRTRRRLRRYCWKQWTHGRRRFHELRCRGINQFLAATTAGSPHGPWHLSNSPALAIALPNAYFQELGLISLASFTRR